MNVTVYFATNRAVTNPADWKNGYPAQILAPSNTAAMTYGRAFVDDIDVATNAQGEIYQIDELSTDGFTATNRADIAQTGRNLLLFLHGFDNSFSDAVTRAAFNAAWLSASGNPAADMTVIAFSWPSLGKLISFPILDGDYHADQTMARNSGAHLRRFFQIMAPTFALARQTAGIKSLLLAHSMGHLALQYGLAQWFLEGDPTQTVFDRAILAAGDSAFNCFEPPLTAGMEGLPSLADRIAILYSHADAVLDLSSVLNLGAQRLGHDGPRHRTDPAAFPPANFTMVDCTGYQDYAFNPVTSHQYYRQSPKVRAIITGLI